LATEIHVTEDKPPEGTPHAFRECGYCGRRLYATGPSVGRYTPPGAPETVALIEALDAWGWHRHPARCPEHVGLAV